MRSSYSFELHHLDESTSQNKIRPIESRHNICFPCVRVDIYQVGRTTGKSKCFIRVKCYTHIIFSGIKSTTWTSLSNLQ